jgi:hypothetical protein
LRHHGHGILAGFAALIVLASGPSAQAANLGQARSFLTALYAHYPNPPPGKGVPFTPTDAKTRASVFDPAMVALLKEDERLTQPGDVGALDGDPLCDCQDDGGLKVQIEPMRPLSASTARVVVVLRFTEARPVDVRRLALDLVEVSGQWRIHDISSQDTPSLRALLIMSNREGEWSGARR